LLVSCQPLAKKAGSESGSASQWFGSADPDTNQNVTDPHQQYWLWIGIMLMTIRIRLFHFDADPDPDPTQILNMLKIQENVLTLIHHKQCQFPLIYLSRQRNECHNFNILYVKLKIADPDPDPTQILYMLKSQENFSTFIQSCASFH
jgi:hypothetical protein